MAASLAMAGAATRHVPSGRRRWQRRPKRDLIHAAIGADSQRRDRVAN
ncbi:MAG: hypothetical protein U0470_03990 [Anaerolineae bacterium]